MELFEKQTGSREIYNGKILHVFCDDVLLPNGNASKREYIKHNGAVCVIPITKEKEVCCVRQFRYPFDEVTLEIPAGKLDGPKENPEKAALRELHEETGLRCEKLTYLGDMYGSPAILGERVYMYMAEELYQGEAEPDADEFLELVRIPLRTLYRRVMDGQIPDAKTQIAVLKAYDAVYHDEPAAFVKEPENREERER